MSGRKLSLLVAIAFALQCSACWAQQVQLPPPENTRPHLSIFTSAHYQGIPAEAALVKAFATDPALVEIRQSTNWHHYLDTGRGAAVYKERFGKIVPPDRFPAIMLQRADGGYVYKATGSNVPSDPANILEEMRHYAQLDPLTGPADSKEARPWNRQIRDISYQLQGVDDVDGPPCPDGNCPLPDSDLPPGDSSLSPAPPDSVELGGGRNHPVRNITALIVIGVGLVVACLVLLGGCLFLAMLVYLFKPKV